MIIDFIGRINGFKSYIPVSTQLTPKDLETLLNLKGGLTKDVTNMRESFTRRGDLTLGDTDIKGLWQITTPIMFTTILRANPVSKEQRFKHLLAGLRGKEDGIWWIRCVDEPTTISLPDLQGNQEEDPTFQDLLLSNSNDPVIPCEDDAELNISDADLALFLDGLTPGQDTTFEQVDVAPGGADRNAIDVILVPEDVLEDPILENLEVVEEEVKVENHNEGATQNGEEVHMGGANVGLGSLVFGSEFGVDLSQWENPSEVDSGEEIVLLEEIDDDTPTIVLDPLTSLPVEEPLFTEPLTVCINWSHLSSFDEDDDEVCSYVEATQ